MFKNKLLMPFSLVFGLFFVLFIWFGEPNFVVDITEEDGFIEYLTAVFYLLGFFLAIVAIIKRKKRLVLAIVWAILCFLFLGEETSWFQRILKYSVPGVENVSSQSEFNLHNLEIFSGDSLFVDGKISKEGIINFLTSTQNMFRLGFFGYFLILPLLTFNKRVKNVMYKIGYVKPSAKFILVLLIVMVLAFVLAILSPEEVKMAMAETREMLYAFFIFLYVGIYIWSQNKTQ